MIVWAFSVVLLADEDQIDAMHLASAMMMLPPRDELKGLSAVLMPMLVSALDLDGLDHMSQEDLVLESKTLLSCKHEGGGDSRQRKISAAIRLLLLLVAKFVLEESKPSAIIKILPDDDEEEEGFGDNLIEMQRKCLQRHSTHPLAGIFSLIFVMFAKLFEDCTGLVGSGSATHKAFMQGTFACICTAAPFIHQLSTLLLLLISSLGNKQLSLQKRSRWPECHRINAAQSCFLEVSCTLSNWSCACSDCF